MRAWFGTRLWDRDAATLRIDVGYHERRARQERVAALRACDPEARRRHDTLAACHESLALLNDDVDLPTAPCPTQIGTVATLLTSLWNPETPMINADGIDAIEAMIIDTAPPAPRKG